MNHYKIPKAEEHVSGWEDYAVRGQIRNVNFDWRVSIDTRGLVALWIVLVQRKGMFSRFEVDDNDPAWIRVASWKPEMPFVEDCVKGLVGLYFEAHEELPQTEFEELCLEITMEEARDEDRRWERDRAMSLAHSLAKA